MKRTESFKVDLYTKRVMDTGVLIRACWAFTATDVPCWGGRAPALADVEASELFGRQWRLLYLRVEVSVLTPHFRCSDIWGPADPGGCPSHKQPIPR